MTTLPRRTPVTLLAAVLSVLLASFALTEAPADAALYKRNVVFTPLTPNGDRITNLWLEIRDDQGVEVASGNIFNQRLIIGETYTATFTDYSGQRVTASKTFRVTRTDDFYDYQYLTVRLARAARVQALVKRQDGATATPAEGATLTAVGDAGTFTGTTTGNGRVRVGSLPPGTYTVTVSDPSGTYAPSPTQVVTLKATNLRDLGTIVLTPA